MSSGINPCHTSRFSSSLFITPLEDLNFIKYFKSLKPNSSHLMVNFKNGKRSSCCVFKFRNEKILLEINYEKKAVLNV